MDQIVETTVNQCKALGVCKKGDKDLSGDISVERISQLFFKYSDFCIGKNTPSLDQLRKFRGMVEEYGLYVDDEIKGLRNKADIALNGECKAMLEYDEYSVSRLYIRHDSKAAVNVSDFAVVTIDLYDHANLALAVAGNGAKVIVNKYGDAKVEYIGQGVIVNNHIKKQ